MKLKRIALVFTPIIFAIFILLYFSKQIFPVKHGTVQLINSEDHAPFVRVYDADKKRWVSESEWMFKYGEFPNCSLSKREWDSKAREFREKR